jgi:CheY-like chemotaxis protein/HPt (histidine-containing phosphotransfer) domain-containing protein
LEAVGGLPEEVRLPIVVVTSRAQRGDASLCCRLGISAYLTWPVFAQDLRDALACLSQATPRSSRAGDVLVTRHYLRESRRQALSLVIADNSSMRSLLGEILGGSGHRVLVSSTTDAPALLGQSNEAPALVVIHVSAEGEHNEEVARLVSTGEPGFAPPSVILVADSEPTQNDPVTPRHDVWLKTPLDADALQRAAKAQIRARFALIEEGYAKRTKLLNKQALLARVGGDEKLAREVVGLFLEHGRHMLQGIRQAISNDTPEELAQTAHTLWSALAMLDVRPAMDHCARLESCGRDGDLGPAPKWLAQLERLVARIQLEMSV